MEITIKNNKLNYEILKKNGQYFFPSSFVLIFAKFMKNVATRSLNLT